MFRSQPRRGATLLDYGLIAVVLVIVSVPIISVVGGLTAGTFSEVGQVGNPTPTPVPTPTPPPVPPVAAFSAVTPTLGEQAPATINFSNQSTNASGWLWNFGDNTTSSETNPSHAYTANGSYTVTLTATGPGGSDSEVKTNFVALGVPVASLTGSYSQGSTDGSFGAARFTNPSGIASDGGNLLFVADTANHTIRRLDLATSTVSTIAGSAGQAGGTDGIGAAARFNNPTALAYVNGILYVADQQNHTIRRIDLATNTVSTLAGSAGQIGTTNGTGSAARFYSPKGLVYGAGILYVADQRRIRRIDIATAAVTTPVGGMFAGCANGTGDNATFNQPRGLALVGNTLYVADSNCHKIRHVDLATLVVSTAAGSGVAGGADGTGTAATFNTPYGLAYDGSRYLWASDYGGHIIRRLDTTTSAVTTIVGVYGSLGSVDGIGASARITSPTALIIVGNRAYEIEASRVRRLGPP